MLKYIIIFLLVLQGFQCIKSFPPKSKFSKDLARLDPILLVSTLDGTLYSVNSKTGSVNWKLDEKPVISVPVEPITTIKGPTFLPDPHDGSLYAFEPISKRISKLPFTIQELVKASPIRTADGILYTGRKLDKWYGLDPATGKKLKVLTTEKLTETCPTANNQNLFIGRSEYQVTMFDTKRNIVSWNVTFADYSSHSIEKTPKNYDYLHLTSTTDGFMISIDRRTGEILWAQNYGYPVVAMYSWQADDGLNRIELTSVAEQTLRHLLSEASDHKKSTIFLNDLNFSPKENMLVPSVYIGQYKNGLYALPALTHSAIQLNRIQGLKMLPGPDHDEEKACGEIDYPETGFDVWRLLGYHRPPSVSKVHLPSVKAEPLTIGCEACKNSKDSDSVTPCQLRTLPGPIDASTSQPPNLPQDNSNNDEDLNESLHELIAKKFDQWSKENIWSYEKLLYLIILGLIFHITRKWWISRNQYFQDGQMKIGRISFDPYNIIGRGSEGTIVFRGDFDGRKVAIKRVIAECFTLADREVALLRESDEHPHVIRYYCTEKDRQFRYIALELCSSTLQEYVENPDFQCSTGLDVLEVLNQAMLGLHHLHELKIVHRDVKPNNILISTPGKLGAQRVVLSDFGLCKKLLAGRTSFSHRSGKMAGTDGWIAPEMILDKKYRMTQAVDIFSMGCVFFYVICGKHPFGDSINRQSRIINGEYDLENLKSFEHSEEAMDIIKRMLMTQPSKRPKTSQILSHPLFWDSVKTLQFFEDVSDRVEKDPEDSLIMKMLNGFILKQDFSNNWLDQICPLLHRDLNKFRTYRNDSVRDLLRAIRNKKHHYRELPEDVKRSLGSLPHQFLHYFTSRFPHLLIHTYNSLSPFQSESELRSYYGCGKFIFDEIPSLDYLKNEEKKKLYSSSSNKFCEKFYSKNSKSTIRKLSPANTDQNWRSHKMESALTFDLRPKWAQLESNFGSRESFKPTESLPPPPPVSYADILSKALHKDSSDVAPCKREVEIHNNKSEQMSSKDPKVIQNHLITSLRINSKATNSSIKSSDNNINFSEVHTKFSENLIGSQNGIIESLNNSIENSKKSLENTKEPSTNLKDLEELSEDLKKPSKDLKDLKEPSKDLKDLKEPSKDPEDLKEPSKDLENLLDESEKSLKDCQRTSKSNKIDAKSSKLEINENNSKNDDSSNISFEKPKTKKKNRRFKKKKPKSVEDV